MPSQPPISPLLSPYLSSSPSRSLTLVTGTLGATVHWLVLRFLAAVTADGSTSSNVDTKDQAEPRRNPKTVLVSWLRDPTVWKDGGRKLRINFHSISLVSALDTGLGLGPNGLTDLERTVSSIVAEFQASSSNGISTLLILDGLDFLLAATGCSVVELLAIIARLREQVHSIILTSNADSALTHAQRSPLEVSHAAFTLNLAHQARMVLGVRELETGGAKDVSGVLRITRGGAMEDNEGSGEAVEEKEYLYQVYSDGGVRVFEKGA